MRRTLATMLAAGLIALSGCQAKEAMDKADIAKDLDKRGTTDLMEEVANDKYDPPANGQLTEAQIQMYLKVREHEKKIAEVAKEELKKHAEEVKKEGDKSLSGMVSAFKGLGSVADIATADIRAAKDLGYNSQEYLWVKQQILAASAAEFASKAGEAISANFDQAYEQAKKAYDEAKDEQTKKMYAEMLAGYEKSKQEMAQQQKSAEDVAAEYNRKLLSKYESALQAYAHEMSKWEDKPGEVQKSVQDWEKNLDEAKKKAEQGQ